MNLIHAPHVRGSLVALAMLTLVGPVGGQQPAQSTGYKWTLVHSRPIGGKYEDFAFPDDRHGWLVNAPGDILHTADGGRTWELQATKMGRLRSVDFLDAKRGFAGTIDGVLHRTDDGGKTWTNISSTLPQPPRGFCGMTHVGDQIHFVGRYYGPVTDYYFSPDGGRTWRHTDLGQLAQGLVDIVFLNAKVGFIGGMAPTNPAPTPTAPAAPPGAPPALVPNPMGTGPAMILKTTDGGQTWRQVFRHDGGRGFAWKVFPITDKLIYSALQSQDGIYRIAKSLDGGETWQVLTAAEGRPQGPGVQGIGFLDANTGWIGGFFPGMWTTTDGGKTWAELDMGDRTINRFVRVGSTLVTAGTQGVWLLERPGER